LQIVALSRGAQPYQRETVVIPGIRLLPAMGMKRTSPMSSQRTPCLLRAISRHGESHEWSLWANRERTNQARLSSRRRHCRISQSSPPAAEVATTVMTAAALRIGFGGSVCLKVATSIFARGYLVNRRITAHVGSAAVIDEFNLHVLRPA